MRSVIVRFPGYMTDYEYLLLPGQDTKVGGQVVVYANSQFKIVFVHKILEEASDKATKAVVAAIDSSIYDNYMKSLKRAESLKKELEKRYKAFEKSLQLEKYDRMARADPQASAILCELKSLGVSLND